MQSLKILDKRNLDNKVVKNVLVYVYIAALICFYFAKKVKFAISLGLLYLDDF